MTYHMIVSYLIAFNLNIFVLADALHLVPLCVPLLQPPKDLKKKEMSGYCKAEKEQTK